MLFHGCCFLCSAVRPSLNYCHRWKIAWHRLVCLSNFLIWDWAAANQTARRPHQRCVCTGSFLSGITPLSLLHKPGEPEHLSWGKVHIKGLLFCVVLHRLSSPDSPFERDRGRTRSSRRRQTDYAINLPATPPLSTYGNHAGSEDSNSEHSYTSYKSSPCPELPYQSTLTHPSPVACYGPPAIPWNGFYHNSRYQSSPKFHRGYHNEEMVYPPHLDLARSYYAQQVPCNQNRYEYSAVPNHRGQRPLPPNPRLSPSPAKYDSPHHRPNSISPQVVNEQLKSWHRRSQHKAPRSRSLDRQGAIRLKNTPGQEATYYQNQKYNEQVIA